MDYGNVVLEGTSLGKGEKLPVEAMESISGHLNIPVLHAAATDDELLLFVKHEKDPITPDVLSQKYAPRSIRFTSIKDYMDRLVGLSDVCGDCLALGTLKGINFTPNTITVSTPLNPETLSNVELIQFGLLRVEPSGNEIRVTH